MAGEIDCPRFLVRVSAPVWAGCQPFSNHAHVLLFGPCHACLASLFLFCSCLIFQVRMVLFWNSDCQVFIRERA
ncbi:hypothetical protein ATANTOWER_005424 [Ataeniobius toweri]|uniref:Uncharacterized protein n=1 Tax=Ataeniobius toweri TaxID=208326 RepID=A0ABU7BWX4_9TELE|nr:hypothetical protein [Ataeniobius toweri]